MSFVASRPLIFLLIAIGATAFFIFYKYFWSRKIDREDVIKLLRTKGIGDRPETIVRNYYKTQGQNLEEKEVKKLTRQFEQNNKESFLTMFDVTKKSKQDTK